MTDQEAIDLGRRAVRCKGWAWKPGMLIRYGTRTRIYDVHRIGGDDGTDNSRPTNGSAWWPDFRCPCTVGGLLALVREAWGDLTIHAHYSPEWGGWYVGNGGNLEHADGRPLGRFPTEVDALVRALECAP